MVEEILRSLAELPLECPRHQRVGEGRHRGLRLRELAGVGGGKEVFVDAEHLRELEGSPLQLAEGLVDRLRIFLIQILAELAAAFGIIPTDHRPAVVLQVIHPDAGSGPAEGGHTAYGTRADGLLIVIPALPGGGVFHGITSLCPRTRDCRGAGIGGDRRRSRVPGSGRDRRRAPPSSR